MDNLLALDIAEGFVAGLLLETDGKVRVVRKYGVVSTLTCSLDEALSDLLDKLGDGYEKCVVSMSSVNFTFRNLVLPFQERQKIEKILPLELEELTLLSGDELHYDFLVSRQTAHGVQVLVAMLQRERMAETIAALQSCGLDPELVTVSSLAAADDIAAGNDEESSFLLADVNEERGVLFLVTDGTIEVIRPLGGDLGVGPSDDISTLKPEVLGDAAARLNIEMKQTLISSGRSDLWDDQVPCYVSGPAGLSPLFLKELKEKIEVPVIEYDAARHPLLKIEPMEDEVWQSGIMNRVLALALGKADGSSVLNLRCGDFRKPKSLKKIGKKGLFAVLALAGVLLAGAGYAFFDYSQLKSERESLKIQVRDVFHETLPEVTRVVQPVQQLKVKIEEARKLYSGSSQGENSLRKVDLLADLSARIPESLQVRFSRLVADEDDVRLKGETADFNTVDNIQKELQKSELFSSVVISSANLAPKGGEVRFELKLEMKK